MFRYLVLFVLALSWVAPSAAHAEGETEAKDGESTVAQEARETAKKDFAAVAKVAKCNEAAIADPAFFADVNAIMTKLDHSVDADRATNNKKHVVMAYGALLAFLVGFVVLLAMRQSKLNGEILRLEAELNKALEDD